MNDMQRQQIKELRETGHSYGRIAQRLGLSENTIKTYCKRHGLGGVAEGNLSLDGKAHFCLYCGNVILQYIGRKEKRFCSDRCRMNWWNSHPEQVKKKAIYHYVCPVCKKPFSVYGNANRKYCSHECYIEDRFGGGKNE